MGTVSFFQYLLWLVTQLNLQFLHGNTSDSSSEVVEIGKEYSECKNDVPKTPDKINLSLGKGKRLVIHDGIVLLGALIDFGHGGGLLSASLRHLEQSRSNK